MGDINLREICKTFPIKTNEGKRKAKGNGLGENKENHENGKKKKKKNLQQHLKYLKNIMSLIICVWKNTTEVLLKWYLKPPTYLLKCQ